MKKLILLVLFYLVALSATGCNPCADADPSDSDNGSTDIIGVVLYPSGDAGGTYSFTSDGSKMELLHDDAVMTSPPQSGKIVYVTHPGSNDGSAELVIADANGSNPKTILTASSSYEIVISSLSPDARYVLFVKDMKGSTDSYLWIIGSDGTGERQVSTDPVAESLPIFSPESKEFAYITNLKELHVQTVQGTEKGVIANDAWMGSDLFARISWSVQNKIAYATNIVYDSSWNVVEPHKIVIINSDGTGKTIVPSTVDCGAPTWNTDGSKLAFHSDYKQIYSVSPNGLDKTLIVDGNGQAVVYPQWSRDGSRVLYTELEPLDNDPEIAGQLKWVTVGSNTTHYVGSSIIWGFWKN